jgi:hypothetical protein
MESHKFDELKSFEELAALSRSEQAPEVDVRLYVDAALSADEAISVKSRREEAPEVDVRLLVRAALLMEHRTEQQPDWMDVMLRLFGLPQVRLALTACFVALFIAATSVGGGDTAQSDDLAEMEDPVMAYLVTGE